MNVSNNGINVIKSEEQFRDKAYRDANKDNGYLICYGNRYHPNGKRVAINDRVYFTANSPEANNYITSHLEANVYPSIRKQIRVDLNQNQFDALCLFSYNRGSLTDDMVTAVNSRNQADIQAAFLRINTISGVYSETLDKRRKNEVQIFFGGSPLASSNLNSNVITLVNQGKSFLGSLVGAGDVLFRVPSDAVNVNKALINDLHTVSKMTGLPLFIGAAITGHNQKTTSGNTSRHIGGFAVDISMIGGVSYASNKHKFTELGNAVAGAFASLGYVRNKESGNPKAFFWQTNVGGNHYNHVHVSCTLSSASALPTDETFQENQASTQQLESPKPSTYAILLNNYEDVNTLQKFIDNYRIQMTPQELMDYSEFDNKASMYQSYSAEQKKQYSEASPDCLAVNTKIGVPYDKYTSRSIYSVNQNIVENYSSCFIEEGIRSLLNNPAYKKISYGGTSSQPILDSVNLYKRENNVQVWIWSKSMDNNGVSFMDISPFITEINTAVNEDGGSFNMGLAHIVYNKDLQDITNLKFSDLNLHRFNAPNSTDNQFFQKDNLNTQAQYGSSDQKAFFVDDNEEFENSGYLYFRRNESFFHAALQNNDLIFIRLEKIGIDDKKLSKPKTDFNVDSTLLADEVLDMIGLIDKVNISSNAQSSEISVGIEGRDLSKLLIDDGVYFFDVEYAVQDREQIIKNSTQSKAGNRLIIPITKDGNGNDVQANQPSVQASVQGFTGDISFNFDQTQSIEEWLTFIFSQLTNIDICPDSIFKGYAEKNFIITRQQTENEFLYKKVLANGIWQAVKLAIDPEIGDRRIADSSFTTATGSLINLIRKVCQKPFVEFFMDTYGSRFYFICRKPPYAEQSFKNNFCLNVFDHDVVNDDLQFTNEIFTWFKLTPEGSIIDTTGGQSLIYLPAVMLPEYMEIWGSKVLDVTTQYLDFDMSQSNQTESNLESIKTQGQQDLDWIIETNAYLPFTREGTISIKPDRRIKRGMNIRYLPTGEIFHVDGVSHKKSFGDKTLASTVIYVSRGMVEQHLEKYFNVVNLLRNSKNTNEFDKDTWTVNQDIFNFFIKRKQFFSSDESQQF